VAGQNDKVSKAIQEQINILKEIFSKWLAEAQEMGILTDAYTPNKLADFLYSNFHGAMVSMKYEQSAQPLEDFLELNFKLLMK
jgi:hypothetical protein